MKRHTRPFRLKEFKVEVTYRCDLNCVHCSSDARPSNSLEMSCADCLRILAEASSIGAQEVAFSGGEPLDWTALPDAVEAAARSKMRTTVYTSGNSDDFEGKARRLRRRGTSRLIFSIFGGTAATHERITRTAGSFERTGAAMLRARAIGLATEVHFVPMATNYRELAEVVDVARECGASIVSILRFVPQGRAALLPSRALNRVQNLELRHSTQELKQNGFQLRVGSPYNFLMLNDNPGCWAAIDRMIIAPDLKMYPCDAFKRIDAVELVGTADYSSLQQRSLPECWRASPYLEAVRTHLTTDFADPCDSCRFLERCLSGCLAQKALASGALQKGPDPDCLGPSFLEDTP